MLKRIIDKLSKMLFRKQIDINKLNTFQLSLICNVKAGNIVRVA